MQSRRRQRKSCVLCRKRKVRCDIDEKAAAEPCSTCDRTGIQCVQKVDWSPPRRQAGVRKTVQNVSPSTTPATVDGRQRPCNEPAPAQIIAVSDDVSQDDAPTNNPETVTPEHLARTGLSQFYEQGIRLDRWRAAEDGEHISLAYIGTRCSNLAHLVNLRISSAPYYISGSLNAWQIYPQFQNQRAQVAPAESGPASDQHDWSCVPPLHYPYPLYLATPKNYSKSDGLPIDSLVEVRADLLRSYFDKIHPIFPIVTKSTFFEADGTVKQSPPKLLQLAVFLAGAHVTSNQMVARSRWMAKSKIYDRARELFHQRQEASYAQRIQAALLFTWHIDSGDTVCEGPWYWAGQAVQIAVGIGAHRTNLALPLHERVLLRRLWWFAFVFEVFAALETGRPCPFRAEDIDQISLQPGDLEWEGDPARSPATHEASTSANDFHLRMVELAYIVLDMLSAWSPASTRPNASQPDPSALDKRLSIWSLRAGLHSSSSEEGLHRTQLRLFYNTVLLHMHRITAQRLEGSQRICTVAADNILSALIKIIADGHIHQCPFFIVGSAMACGIQMARDLRAAVKAGTVTLCLDTLESLQRLVECSKSMAALWPSATSVHAVFESLHREYQQSLSMDIEGEATPLCGFPDPDLDWNALMASMFTSSASGADSEQNWHDFMQFL